ncbi:hypothetical protein FA95DRAFT_1598422 [Auriscalpium vulgare]|uniref:Uncharacterized protein n=1 Tax=Auriscalpium vulgare TaxID=40419 RepID=A0ACB8REV9_9AGAM|nr:hypothetical protein FA95DRAFT_1598422 [Auriscalpium vulgare]
MPRVYFFSLFLAPNDYVAFVDIDIDEEASASDLVDAILHKAHYTAIFAEAGIKRHQLSLYSLRVHGHSEKRKVSPDEKISQNRSWTTPGHIQLILNVHENTAFMFNKGFVQAQSASPSTFASKPSLEKRIQDGAHPFKGPYLFIRGAVQVGVPIIQRLANPIVLGGETYLEDSAAPGQAPPLWLTSLKFLDRLDGGYWHPTVKHKNYVRSLFSAKLGDKPVIVKICERYGEKAHRLLAANGLAPHLHYCVELMGWGKMVVMDEVTGRDASVASWGTPLPVSVKTDVKRAMKILHDARLVFGDLRRPNVMVVSRPRRADGEEDERAKKTVLEEGAMLVDFDWAGDVGLVKYPVVISDDIRKSGAQPWGPILFEHDEYMMSVL